MAYTPTEWSRGDVVTSEKLNKLEQGVAEAGGGSGGGYLKVEYNSETDALDKTWKEIHDAFSAGYYVSLIIYEGDVGMARPVTLVGHEDGDYFIGMFNPTNPIDRIEFVTDSENGYPVVPSGGGGEQS